MHVSSFTEEFMSSLSMPFYFFALNMPLEHDNVMMGDDDALSLRECFNEDNNYKIDGFYS